MEKPNIIVFQNQVSPVFQHVTSRYFDELKEKYNFFFEQVDYSRAAPEYIDILLAKYRQLERNIDGVIGLLDRETLVAALLAEKLHLPGIPVKAVFQAQHKADFVRIMQEIDPHFPETHVIHIDENLDYTKFLYPCFVRPIKGGESELAFWAKSKGELQEMVQKVRKIQRPHLAWYDAIFARYVDRPYEDIERTFIVQPFIEGDQYVVDGFVFNTEVSFLGYTKSVFADDKVSFISFDFPTPLEVETKTKLEDLIRRLLTRIGYNNYGFNIEFIVTPDGKIFLIEVNTRISRQFIPLMNQYYTLSNLELMLQVATGEKPHIELKNQTRYASSFPLRIFKDARVKAVPSPERIQELKKELGLIDLTIYINQGDKINLEESFQTYSYRYGIVDIAGNSTAEIKEHFEKVKDKFEVEFEYL